MKDSSPGADLLKHTRRGDLLAVTVPLALRKRAAQFRDADSEDEVAHQAEETPPSKRLKKATESTARKEKIKATVSPTSKTKGDTSQSVQPNGKAEARSQPEKDADASQDAPASGGQREKQSKQKSRQAGDVNVVSNQPKETLERPVTSKPKQASSTKAPRTALAKAHKDAKPSKDAKQSEAGESADTQAIDQDLVEVNDATAEEGRAFAPRDLG